MPESDGRHRRLAQTPPADAHRQPATAPVGAPELRIPRRQAFRQDIGPSDHRVGDGTDRGGNSHSSPAVVMKILCPSVRATIVPTRSVRKTAAPWAARRYITAGV